MTPRPVLNWGRTTGLTGALAAVLAAGLLLGGCTSSDGGSAQTGPPDRVAPGPVSLQPAADTGADPDVNDPALDAALSTPVEDRVYPGVGDPSVDALSYDLNLAWTPDTHTLTAVETLVFRATTTGDSVQLDLGQALVVSSLRVDGAKTAYDHTGKDLVVHTPVVADRRYVLSLAYAGVPRAVAAPTTRSDFSTLGWTINDRDETWTMQEPFGAYSYYAVNDQPSDKALYSFTLSAPTPMVGVANGVLESRTTSHLTTVTRWVLDEPASSYLVTVTIADLEMIRERTVDDVPVTYWVPRAAGFAVRGLRVTPDAMKWLEERLGPFPFSSLGIVLVDSRSGMETQTMITLGLGDYTTSPGVIVHELAHQWYGDEVTPTDWRDMWMNEGMAMFLQGVYQAEQDHRQVDAVMADWAAFEPDLRRESGPPADYDPATFGEGNVYYGPALMWNELRHRLGDAEFWRLVRAWPSEHAYANADYDAITSWWSRETGLDLTSFFDDWLLGKTTPPRTGASRGLVGP